MNVQKLRARGISAILAASLHALFTALFLAALCWGFFAPTPLPILEIGGARELILLTISVSVACGPILTLVIFNPEKPQTELQKDIFVIIATQIAAICYGIHVIAYARPTVLAYEVDQFRLVSYADLEESANNAIPEWVRGWRWTAPRTVALRAPVSAEERNRSIEASLQGIEPSQRPDWWQDYEVSKPHVLRHARPLVELFENHPTEAARIDIALAKAIDDKKPHETSDPGSLKWLPLISRRTADWVVLLDPTSARVRGYLHLSGF